MVSAAARYGGARKVSRTAPRSSHSSSNHMLRRLQNVECVAE
jgi:hypothetical protein